MSTKEKMLEAQSLIKAGRYSEARAILKTVNHPKAHEWLAKIDKVAPQKTPVVKANRTVVFAVLGLAVVILLGVVMLVLVSNRGPSPDEILATQIAGTQVAAQATLEYLGEEIRIDLWATLSTYCQSAGERSQGSCRRWADIVTENAEHYPQALACYSEYDWIWDRDNFSWCLLNFGISVLSDQAFIQPIDLTQIGNTDIDGIIGLEDFCEYGSRGDDFCRVWALESVVTYQNIVYACLNDWRPLQGGFVTCIETNGITRP